MSLLELEKRLKSFDQRFHIKRYGTSMAAVHFEIEHLFRVPQGEITLYNVTEVRGGEADQYKSSFNPAGKYKYNHMVRRGIGELAHLLQMGGKITGHQAAILRNGGVNA